MNREMRRKILTASAAALALSAVWTGAAAETLDEVVVTAERENASLPGGFQREKTNFGLLGDTDVMNVPYTAQSFTEKTMETMAGTSKEIDQVLANVPSIRIGTSPIKTDFSARGMLANGSAMYTNDIPGFYIMCAGPVTNAIGRADVLVGPAATMSGTVQSYNGPDAGQPASVYLYTKRAEGKDFNRLTLTTSGHGAWGGLFDVSRSKLGKNGEWGLRVYGQDEKIGFSIDGAERERKNIFADITRETEKSRTNIFAGYYDDRLKGTERRFAIARNSRWVPAAPNSHKSYDDPESMYSNWYGWMMTVNHEQKMNENLSWFVNFGMNETTVRRYIYNTQISINDMGDVVTSGKPGAVLWSQYFLLQNRYGQLGFKATAKTGAIEHDLTLSVDRSWRKQYNNNTHKDKAGDHVTGGNIYTGIHFSPDTAAWDNAKTLPRMFMYQEMDTSLNLIDNMKIGKWTVLAAGTRRHGNYRGKAKKNHIKDDQWSPTFGVTYAPNDAMSVYAAYAKSTTRGVPVTGGYENDGDVLPPVKVEQKEIGVKYKWDRMYASIAYFDMKQPNYLDVATATGTIYALDGENRYKGVDFNITGEISRKWNIFGGFEYLNGKQRKTAGGKNDGMPTDSSAKWSTVLGLEYTPNDAWSLMGRLNYVGHGVIVGNNRNELRVPSSTSFDFFVKYKTEWSGTPVTLSAACYNVFDRDYWLLQPGQGNKLMLSMPRSFVLSASFDF